MNRPAILRPLDRLPTIRSKLGAVIVFAVAVTIAIMYVFVGLALHSEDRFRERDQLRQQAKTIAAVGFDRSGKPLRSALHRAINGQTAAAVVIAGNKRIVSNFPLPVDVTAADTSTGGMESSVGIEDYVGMPVVRDGKLYGAVFLAKRAPRGGVYGTLRSAAAFVYHHVWALLLAGAASAAIALFLARILARGMTQPIRDMAEATERLARGDYSERVEVTTRDELGRLSETFNRMAAELESVERLRRDLVANVSHELKTPISALRAHLENILDGVEEPKPATITIMLQQSERLGRLVEQLLDLSRLESGTVALDREPVALGPIVDRVIGEVRVGRDDSVFVERRLPADLPFVLADGERVHQVLLNLVDNALRFTPPGGRVTVSAIRQDDRCEVSVEDTGPGIPEAHQPFVFERFYRVDPARSRSDGGTGIGLTIARSVVEAHGGRIWVDRAQSGGAAFRFTLPFAGNAPAGAPAGTAASEAAGARNDPAEARRSQDERGVIAARGATGAGAHR